MTLDSRGLLLTDLLSEFVKFLNASGYAITDGTSINIDDGGECSIQHPEEPKECKCGKDCCSEDDDVEVDDDAFLSGIEDAEEDAVPFSKPYDPLKNPPLNGWIHNPLTGKPYPNIGGITGKPLEDYVTSGLMYTDEPMHNIPHPHVRVGSNGMGSVTTNGYIQRDGEGIVSGSITTYASYPYGTTASHTMQSPNISPITDTSTSGFTKGRGLLACKDCYHECDDCDEDSNVYKCDEWDECEKNRDCDDCDQMEDDCEFDEDCDGGECWKCPLAIAAGEFPEAVTEKDVCDNCKDDCLTCNIPSDKFHREDSENE